MLLQELWEFLEKELFPKESKPDLFNQYQSIDENLDLPDGASRRRNNLQNYFESFSAKPSILLVGEAAGPWGCRFSGVPFTGEKQICEKSLAFPGERSSRTDPQCPIAKIPPFNSSSAEAFWEILRPYHSKFFVWDCVPFYPHKKSDPVILRTPRKREIKEFLDILDKIIQVIRPSKILAIGRKAERALSDLGRDSTYIRHPAHGGGTKFRDTMREFFAHECDCAEDFH